MRQLGVLEQIPAVCTALSRQPPLVRLAPESMSLNMIKVPNMVKYASLCKVVSHQRLTFKWLWGHCIWRRPKCSARLLIAAASPRMTENDPAGLLLCCFCTDSGKVKAADPSSTQM